MTTIKIIFLIISSIIGAGFVSGKEIFVYFSSFGIYGLVMIIPLFFIFYFYIKTLLNFGIKNNTLYFSKIILKKSYLYNIFCFLTFTIISSTMFAGINSVFNYDVFSIKYIILYFIVFILCICVIYFGIEKFSKLNAIITPIVILTFIFAIFLIDFDSLSIQSNSSILFSFSSVIIYACSNIFLSHYIIIESSKNLSQKQINLISFGCSFGICILITFCIVIELCHPEICQFDMPLLYASKSFSFKFYVLYCFVIVYSILSTLFSSLFSLKHFFKLKNKWANIVAPVFISFCFSFFGFSNLIKFLYPIIGIIGLIIFIKLIEHKHNL